MSIQNVTYMDVNAAREPIPEIKASPTVVQQEVPSVQISNSQIHPSLQIEDDARRTMIESSAKTSTRPSFGNLLDGTVSESNHKKVEDVLVSFVKNSEPLQYKQYLVNLEKDIELIESSLKNLSLPLKSLPKLYFLEKLQKDLKHFNFEGDVSEMVKKYNHTAYYTSRQSKPHLLLAHYSVHALGLLAGGIILSKMIEKKWGKEATHLYDFPALRDLRSEFKDEMNAYVESMSKTEFNEFQIEIKSSWEYIGDLLNIDIRKEKKS